MSWEKWNGSIAENIMKGISVNAVTETLNTIGNATDCIIPLDEGPLKNSRYSKVKVISNGQSVNGILAYGGGRGTGKPKLPYAIRWHENHANFQHGRQSNYLRGPFSRIAEKQLYKILGSEMKSKF